MERRVQSIKCVCVWWWWKNCRHGRFIRCIYYSAFEAKSITILFSPNLFHSYAIHKAIGIVIASIPLRSGYFIYIHVQCSCFFYRDEISHLWFMYPHIKNDRLSPSTYYLFGFAKKNRKIWGIKKNVVRFSSESMLNSLIVVSPLFCTTLKKMCVYVIFMVKWSFSNASCIVCLNSVGYINAMSFRWNLL